MPAKKAARKAAKKPAPRSAKKGAGPAKTAKATRPTKPAKRTRKAAADQGAKPAAKDWEDVPADEAAWEEVGPDEPAGWAAAGAPASAAPLAVPTDGPPAQLAAAKPGAPKPRPFDPTTGEWLPVAESGGGWSAMVPPHAAEHGRAAASPPSPASSPAPGQRTLDRPFGPTPIPDPLAPEAPRRGVAYIVWSILLGIDLALVGVAMLIGIVAGLVLIFAPDSELAGTFRDAAGIDSPDALFADAIVSLVLFGLIPLVWVLGTRRVPGAGMLRYLRLHDAGRGILRGIGLAVALLVAIALLSSLYTLATDGPDAFSDPEEDTNPAVEAILANLTWPLVVVVALSAGIGEEILFRGVLQRWIGIWPQAILFGLAHSGGGYPPQIIFAFGLGVLFGYLLKRGWSLWTLIVAHFLYDLALLALGLALR